MIEHNDAATLYARAVVAGEIPAGKYHLGACARHLRDLDTAGERGLEWRPEHGERCDQFFATVLRHYQGEWAGQPIVLEPWQKFIVYSLLGWRQAATGFRRFRTSFVELPRGNGKSTIAGGLGLWLTFFDGEPGAQSFVIATKTEQAKIVFEAARQMVLASPSLMQRLGVFKNNLYYEQNASKLMPLGADAKTLDGLRPYFVCADEVHAHPTPDLINIMETGMGTRRDPLMFEITTAGTNRTGPWWPHREYTQRVLDQSHVDDTWFGLIAAADAEDDWTQLETAIKANPNYGVSVKPEKLIADCNKAQAMSIFESDFRRLHLGQLVSQQEKVIQLDDWRACARDFEKVDLKALRRQPCYGGLDLSRSDDITAFVLLFPIEETRLLLIPHFWIPAERVAKRVQLDRVPVDVWIRQGWLHTTPGNIIDFRSVRADILAACANFNVREVGYDPWSALETATTLEDEGLTMVPIRQGFVTISEPTKRFIAMVQARQIEHDGNPVMEWMIDNFAIKTDPAGNLKPDKEQARERIDGVAAAITGLARAMLIGSRGGSVYRERGIVTL